MKSNSYVILLLAAALVLLLTMGTAVLAQSSAGFNLERYVIGSGGGESTSASYHVDGTIGQSITSQPTSASANFTVSSGYWFGDTGRFIYLPAILKNQ